MHVLLQSTIDILKRIIISYGMYYHKVVTLSQCFLFFNLKNTCCYTEISSKATNKNEVSKKFCNCWGLTPAGLTNYSRHVKNYMLQQMQLKHYHLKR